MYFLVGFSVLLIVVMVLLVRGSRLESGGIVLPEPQADTAAVGEEGTETRLNVVTISPDTVRPAINTLARSLLYSRAQTVETFWSGGSGQTVYQVYVSGGRTRIDTQLPGGSVRHTLCSGGSAAVWYDDDTAWTVLRSSELTADRLQRMPTYELVRDLEVDTIAAAGGAVGMGLATAKSAESIARQPEAEGKVRTTLMLGLVFIETAIIYALLVVILIIFVL